MVDPNEIVMLILGVVVLFFLLLNLQILRAVRHWPFLVAAYGIILVSWFLTVLETYFLPSVLNHVEHLCDMAGAVLLLVWVYLFLRKDERAT